MSESRTLNESLLAMLCPPGGGVQTIGTGTHYKEALQEKLYGCKAEGAVQAWQQHLTKLSQSKIGILGIASDVGGGILHGAAWGPLFVRQALYESNDLDVLDLGDVRVIPHLLHDKYLNEATITNCRKALYGDANRVLPVSPLSMAEKAAHLIYKANPELKLLGVGGDHSCSYPLVKACLEHHHGNGRRIGLVHFDAHTDLLEERLGIDICFGSWTSHVIPMLKEAQDCVQIGIRATGRERSHWESTFDIQQIWAREVLQEGPTNLIQRMIAHLKAQGVDGLYISFDIDCIDEKYVSATGTPESGGLSPVDCVEMINALGNAFDVVASDVMEVAPFTLPNLKRRADEPESTLAVAKDISEALLAAMA